VDGMKYEITAVHDSGGVQRAILILDCGQRCQIPEDLKIPYRTLHFRVRHWSLDRAFSQFARTARTRSFDLVQASNKGVGLARLSSAGAKARLAALDRLGTAPLPALAWRRRS
jgi:hypothetical protein